MSDVSRKHGVFDQGKYRKWADKQKWADSEYHAKKRSILIV